MNIWKKPWFIPIVLTIIIVIGGQLYTSGKLTNADSLSEKEIIKQLELIYEGKVDNLVLEDSVYHAKVSKAGSEYAVKVDAETGKVLALVQTKESIKTDVAVDKNDDKGKEVTEDTGDQTTGKEPEKVTPPTESSTTETKQPAGSDTEKPQPNPEKMPAQTNPSSKPSTPPKKTAIISEQQAAKIALAQLPAGMVGEVDDVDFEVSEDGGYYLVQIDIDTDEDLDEVTYQIHAITGKVKTTTWDD